jgi:hypothetical protein
MTKTTIAALFLADARPRRLSGGDLYRDKAFAETADVWSFLLRTAGEF